MLFIINDLQITLSGKPVGNEIKFDTIPGFVKAYFGARTKSITKEARSDN